MACFICIYTCLLFSGLSCLTNHKELILVELLTKVMGELPCLDIIREARVLSVVVNSVVNRGIEPIHLFLSDGLILNPKRPRSKVRWLRSTTPSRRLLSHGLSTCQVIHKPLLNPSVVLFTCHYSPPPPDNSPVAAPTPAPATGPPKIVAPAVRIPAPILRSTLLLAAFTLISFIWFSK